MAKTPKQPKTSKPVKAPKVTPKIKVVKGYTKSNGQFVNPYIKGLFKN